MMIVSTINCLSSGKIPVGKQRIHRSQVNRLLKKNKKINHLNISKVGCDPREWLKMCVRDVFAYSHPPPVQRKKRNIWHSEEGGGLAGGRPLASCMWRLQVKQNFQMLNGN